MGITHKSLTAQLCPSALGCTQRHFANRAALPGGLFFHCPWLVAMSPSCSWGQLSALTWYVTCSFSSLGPDLCQKLRSLSHTLHCGVVTQWIIRLISCFLLSHEYLCKTNFFSLFTCNEKLNGLVIKLLNVMFSVAPEGREGLGGESRFSNADRAK